MEKIISNIIHQIKLGEEISPFLFTAQNTELLNSQVEIIAKALLKEFLIPEVYLNTLIDNNENIKVKEVKEFINQSNSTVPYKFQIFFIENISRLSLGASNSLLKFLEEPWKQNIIFLSNRGESNILDTILSRVQIINLAWNKKDKRNEFYISLLDNYLNNNNTDLISYFFNSKLEKEEYLDFLENLIIYSKEKRILISPIEEINEDINLIEKNNLNPRIILDKWLLRLK